MSKRKKAISYSPSGAIKSVFFSMTELVRAELKSCVAVGRVLHDFTAILA